MNEQTTIQAVADPVRRFIERHAREGMSVLARTSEERGNPDIHFDAFALEVFRIQYATNPAYRRLCDARRRNPGTVSRWQDIPTVPTAAFKEFEFSCLPPVERTTVFHSSGTTGHRPGQHFHSGDSIALYEASLTAWFRIHLLPEETVIRMLSLTPDRPAAPHSSLVYMFDTVARHFGRPDGRFVGMADAASTWGLDREAAAALLRDAEQHDEPLLILGTAFSFVHLLDDLARTGRRFRLPPGSRVLETGGYKGRSRSVPKAELHRLMTERLGIDDGWIVSEYGMSELSSQAYDRVAQPVRSGDPAPAEAISCPRRFHFPPWTRCRIVSPEHGLEVAEGETGLIQVFDLANVWSVMALQTEDLGVRRENGFELVGRAALAEPRGCSLLPSGS